MANLQLTNSVDFGLLYDIDIGRYDPEFVARHGLTREFFISRLEHFPSVGYEFNGRAIGGMFFDGKQPHLAVLPEFHGRWAPLWKPTLVWLFSIQDPILSNVEVHNEQCLQFMDRNNWKRVKTDEKYVTYEMTAKGHRLFAAEKVFSN